MILTTTKYSLSIPTFPISLYGFFNYSRHEFMISAFYPLASSHIYGFVRGLLEKNHDCYASFSWSQPLPSSPKSQSSNLWDSLLFEGLRCLDNFYLLHGISKFIWYLFNSSSPTICELQVWMVQRKYSNPETEQLKPRKACCLPKWKIQRIREPGAPG